MPNCTTPTETEK